MLKEFKDFIMTGNVIDFAVAVIMATALGGVINGFVNNIAMPFVGYFAGGMNFEDMHHAMDGQEYATLAAAKEAGAEIAIEKMAIPDHGTIAIAILGGIECGFWQS